MAKILDLLNVFKEEPKRSWFDRSTKNKFSMSPGIIYPIFCEEIIPNSICKLNFTDLFKSDAMIGSMYGKFRLSYQAFFVPSRLYNQAMDSNAYRPIIDSAITPFDDEFPVLNLKDYDINNLAGNCIVSAPRGSLLEMLGYLPPDLMINLYNTGDYNAIPFLAYYDICRSYYINPQSGSLPIIYATKVATLGIPSTDGIDSRFIQWDYQDNVISLEELSDFYNDVYTSPRSQNVIQALMSLDAVGAKLLNSYSIANDRAVYINGNTELEASVSYPYIEDEYACSPHNGFCVRPYDDNYFSVALNANFVDVSQSVSVNIVDNKLKISQLIRGNALQNFVNNNVFFSGTTYGDWLKAHFGVKSNKKLRIPEFLGSFSHDIFFDDIYATASNGDEVDNNRVGDRSSTTSTSANTYNKDNFVEFEAQEHGYLMVMCSLVPIPTFSQGQPKMLQKLSLSDCYSPEFDAVGFQDLLKSELYFGQDMYNAITSLPNNLIPAPFLNTVVGKQPAWMEYMTNYDRSHGLLASDERSYWTLNRNFASVENVSIYDINEDKTYLLPYNITFDNNDLYIKPQLYNKMFYNQNAGVDHFYNQVAFDFKAKQPMSKQILPRL